MPRVNDFANGYSCILDVDFIKENPDYSAFFMCYFQFITDKMDNEDSYGFSIADIIEDSPRFEGFLTAGKFQPILDCALNCGFIVPLEDDPGRYLFDFDIELGKMFGVISYKQFENFYKDFFEDCVEFNYKRIEYCFRCYVTMIKYHNYFSKKLYTNYEFSISRLLGKACVPMSKKNREYFLYLMECLEYDNLIEYHRSKEQNRYVIDYI